MSETNRLDIGHIEVLLKFTSCKGNSQINTIHELDIDTHDSLIGIMAKLAKIFEEIATEFDSAAQKEYTAKHPDNSRIVSIYPDMERIEESLNE